MQYRTLAPGSGVASFDPKAPPSDADRLARERWQKPELDLWALAKREKADPEVRGGVEVASGGRLKLFQEEGPGVILALWLRPEVTGGEALRRLVLRAWWDGAEAPAVEVPVADFFGDGLSPEEALARGLAEKAAEFREEGGGLYRPA